jgi:hypothetical protein
VVLNLVTGRIFNVPASLRVGLRSIVLGELPSNAERALSEDLSLARYVVRERLRSLKRDLLAEQATPSVDQVHQSCGKVQSHHLATAPIVYPSAVFKKRPGCNLLLLAEDEAVAAALRHKPSPRSFASGPEAEDCQPDEVWMVRGFSASGIGIVLEAQSPEDHVIACLKMLTTCHSPEAWRREMERLGARVRKTLTYAARLPEMHAWRVLEEMYPAITETREDGAKREAVTSGVNDLILLSTKNF